MTPRSRFQATCLGKQTILLTCSLNHGLADLNLDLGQMCLRASGSVEPASGCALIGPMLATLSRQVTALCCEPAHIPPFYSLGYYNFVRFLAEVRP